MCSTVYLYTLKYKMVVFGKWAYQKGHGVHDVHALPLVLTNLNVSELPQAKGCQYIQEPQSQLRIDDLVKHLALLATIVLVDSKTACFLQ